MKRKKISLFLLVMALLGVMPMAVNAGPDAVVNSEGITTMWFWDYVEGETGEYSTQEDIAELLLSEMEGFQNPLCVGDGVVAHLKDAKDRGLVVAGIQFERITFESIKMTQDEGVINRVVRFEPHFDREIGPVSIDCEIAEI